MQDQAQKQVSTSFDHFPETSTTLQDRISEGPATLSMLHNCRLTNKASNLPPIAREGNLPPCQPARVLKSLGNVTIKIRYFLNAGSGFGCRARG